MCGSANSLGVIGSKGMIIHTSYNLIILANDSVCPTQTQSKTNIISRCLVLFRYVDIFLQSYHLFMNVSGLMCGLDYVVIHKK